MPLPVCMASLVSFLLFAADESAVPVITEIQGVRPKQSTFSFRKPPKPIVIKSASEAADYFDAGPLAKVEKQVDFGKQLVLVFAWRGSGQDRLKYVVAKSSPEQVSFSFRPGRTRDLRPHVHVYALRSNVTWSGPKQTRRRKPPRQRDAS